MKKTNKRGFTIVELVIVIAVIAILAAVLIPTFSGLIKKANLSNDKSFVRNMNTTLAAEGALEKFDSAGDAIDALNRNGFGGKYNTYSTNFHYCYSLENNRMYLLDDNNVVVYPEEEVAVSSLWGLYMDSRTSVTSGVTKYIAMTNITNSAHYNDVFASGTYTIDLNISQEWDKVSDTPLAMGCIVVKNSFLAEHKSVVDSFLNDYKDSIEYINNKDNFESAVDMIVKAGITPKEALAKSALANLYGSIVYIDGDDMKTTLVGFYNAIGQALPKDDFYYEK